MKKFTVMFLALVLLALLAAPAMAATGITGAVFVDGLPQYFVNDQAPGIDMDAAPCWDDDVGHEMVPVRYLADALGAKTDWDASTQAITVSTAVYSIKMVVGSNTMTVNGQTQTMDVAPELYEGRTYLPAQCIADVVGYQVNCDEDGNVIIWPVGAREPDYPNVDDYLAQLSQMAQQGYAFPPGF